MPLVAGKGLRFNGLSDYVSIPHSQLLDLGSANFVIKTRVTFGNNVSGWNVIVAKENWDASTGWLLYLTAGNTLVFTKGGVAAAVSYTFTLSFGRQYEIRVENDATTIKMYVDGILVATNTGSLPIFTPNTETVLIGARHNNTGGNTHIDHFPGVVQELRIFKNGELVAEYLMQDDGTGRLTDTSGSGNHGTVYGATFAQKKPIRQQQSAQVKTASQILAAVR